MSSIKLLPENSAHQVYVHILPDYGSIVTIGVVVLLLMVIKAKLL